MRVRNRASSPCRSVRLAAIWTAIEVPIVARPGRPGAMPEIARPARQNWVAAHTRRPRCRASTIADIDVYELSVDLRSGVRDTDFVAALDTYLGALQQEGRIESWRLLRRKLGFGVGTEFKVLIETRDLAQLDAAFQLVSSRADPIEQDHHGVNSLVVNFQAALFRDFPDPQRVHGDERF